MGDERLSAPLASNGTGLCGCGCGELVSPGNRFLPHHYARTIRRADSPQLVSCPQCPQQVRVRQDGTLGTHFATSSRFGEHFRCSGGGLPPLARTPGRGRRVTVSVDVVLPDGWDIPRLKAEAGQALRDRMQELLVVSVDVNEAS